MSAADEMLAIHDRRYPECTVPSCVARRARKARAEQAERAMASLPGCSWPGCESKARRCTTTHEGMHEDDVCAEAWCDYHEAELVLAANIEHQVIAGLFPLERDRDLWAQAMFEGGDVAELLTEAAARAVHDVWLAEARGWLEDCFAELPADLTDTEVEQAIARYYDGGVAAFTRDTATLIAGVHR